MSSDKIKGQLELKSVTLDDFEQFNDLLKYVFQVTSTTEEEGGYAEGEFDQAKMPVLERSDVIGWFRDDQLVSQICVYPLKVNMHGKIMDMGGVTGVGTYPEYANLGLMKELIGEALKRMKNEGQYISYLYPYSVPYYRRKGWEIITDRIRYVVRDYQLPKYEKISGHVERLPIDHPDVLETYNKYALANHGALIRSELDWAEYWRWEKEEERTAAVYYNEDDQPEGYILYWVARDVFHIKDMIYMNQDGRIALWNFISAHFSMIDFVHGNNFTSDPIAFLMEDAQIEEKIQPYYMGRIVDVENFLKAYPFTPQSKPFHFKVYDPVANWNNGIFALQWDDQENLTVSSKAIGSEIRLDIGTLTSMLMSYRRPSYYHEIEKIMTDKLGLRLLEQAVPESTPYFSDYF